MMATSDAAFDELMDSAVDWQERNGLTEWEAYFNLALAAHVFRHWWRHQPVLRTRALWCVNRVPFRTEEEARQYANYLRRIGENVRMHVLGGTEPKEPPRKA